MDFFNDVTSIRTETITFSSTGLCHLRDYEDREGFRMRRHRKQKETELKAH